MTSERATAYGRVVATLDELTTHLASSERWTVERANRLFDDVAECGPVTPVH